MTKLGLIASAITCSLLFSQASVAQRGQGGGSQAPAGTSGVMTAPGRTDTDMEQGRGSTPQQGKSEQHSGKPTGSEPEAAQTSAKSQQTVSEQLASNSKLSAKLQGLFPAGTQLSDAASGFKNLGDFVSAAHVSHNLGIPFADLKGKMTGGKSLGEAIHELQPDVDHQAEAKKANAQANKSLKDSGL